MNNGNPPPKPADMFDLWARGFNTATIAKLVGLHEAEVEKWLNHYLDDKIVSKCA